MTFSFCINSRYTSAGKSLSSIIAEVFRYIINPSNCEKNTKKSIDIF